MNSLRVFASFLKEPSKAVVAMVASSSFTPRIIEHICTPSITTATPCGLRISSNSSAIYRVIRSRTWRRRANISTMRGILDRPMIFSSGT